LANLQRILKRWPDVDEAELERLRLHVLARLAGPSRGEADDPPAYEEDPAAVSPIDDDTRAGDPTRPSVPVITQAPSPWLLVAPLEDDSKQAEAPAEPAVAGRPAAPIALPPAHSNEAWPPALPGFVVLDQGPMLEVVAAEPAVTEADESSQPGLFALDERPVVDAPVAQAPHAETPVAAEAVMIEPEPRVGAIATPDLAEPTAIEPVLEVVPRRRRGPPPARTGTATQRPAGIPEAATPIASPPSDPVEATAYCPSCACPLQPPPEATRRCPQCRQRIVVRHLGTRTVYLAEAVLPVFEAERRRALEAERQRVLDAERRARERARWLDLARESGAAADAVELPATELVSEADVAAARGLYLSTVDRSVRVAKDDRRWEEAARIRYEQALVLLGIAGSPTSPPDEVVKLHREGVGADLQAIGEVAKDAELHGVSCCDSCRGDEGRVVRIADELRSPTLPHRGCPTGLCLCRWFLSARDQEYLSEFLRRQAVASRRLTAPAD
jgi:hypothetical protein